jgi:DNA-3-methyladenine glycosylase
MAKLKRYYYHQEDVVSVARDLLGKTICTRIDGKLTCGIITETEAYAGVGDKASHAYGGKRTARNEVMYHPGGKSYVYLCYGLHHLFNVVTNKADVPHAVLIRAIKPTVGIETILRRRRQNALAKNTAGGPGTVSQALGITTQLNGEDLINSKKIWIRAEGLKVKKSQIVAGPRIGVDYAGEDAKLPYRFVLKDI